MELTITEISFYKTGIYFDSVTLMVLSSQLKALEEVQDVQVSMGTDHNKMLLEDIGFDISNIKKSSPQMNQTLNQL